MMNSEWLKLRPFNGDIKNGFEELVCQLARAESIANKDKFIRVAAPDGGAEAYCVLANRDEYGWQAKFFTTMSAVQWKQLDESFKTAFDKHPRLVKYFICLPLDRPDPRIITQKGKNAGQPMMHFMDKWNEKVEEWQSYALSQGRKIEFEYWGTSELFDRLSKKENSGKLYYWFGQEEFSDEWFTQKLKESIANLGGRYTPELNFELPFAKIFDGLAGDKFSQEQFESHINELLNSYKKSIPNIKVIEVKELVQKVISDFSAFYLYCDQIDFSLGSKIDREHIENSLNKLLKIIKSIIKNFYELNSEQKGQNSNNQQNGSLQTIYDADIESLIKLCDSLDEFIEYINNPVVSLSNNPFMILLGDQGNGKSHLLADIAEKRLQQNHFTILLLGQHFTSEEPWEQIKKLLHIHCDRDTFLSVLNSKAESMNSRILIFIDALNEGEGKSLWKKYIAGIIETIKGYPNLGIVFSVRTPDYDLIIPKSVEEDKEVIKVPHFGFSGYTYEASKLFFNYYRIKQPSIPLLNSEFSNPLFLKLFCEGLQRKQLHEIPDGYVGITSIIDFYLDSINTNISDKHNLHRNLETVQKLIRRIAIEIFEADSGFIKLNELFSLITNLPELSSVSDKPQFFRDLFSEGLFTINQYSSKENNSFNVVYFAYEKFSDYMVSSHLIEKYLNMENPKESFRESNPFFMILKDENTASYHRGILEALSVQLPELANIELFEVVEHARGYEPVVRAFINSILWRKKETLTAKLVNYINEMIVPEPDIHKDFFDVLLLITSRPNNYFNSDFLHKQLMRFSMADRDAEWTQLIHDEYPSKDTYNISVIQRMIDWAWTNESREAISDESIRLMCQTMCWFLTSCNRILRDSATKAIICILEERINVVILLLKTFEKVNDPYVLQRLYAIAYGCTVRTSQISTLKDLGEYVFQTIFNTDNVVPDILLRDYATGIIDYAISKGHTFDSSKTHPPFNSSLPIEFPSNEETDKYLIDTNSHGFKRYYGNQNVILYSMVTEYGRGLCSYGDFGRYVFESAFKHHWKGIDANGLSNLAVKYIFEKYGYNVEKHGEFDSRIRTGRFKSTNIERIGKKYQWIALHELLARVADNYEFYDGFHKNSEVQLLYEGAWQIHARDIDPTITTKVDQDKDLDKFWWFNSDYSNWNCNKKEWLITTSDLPNPLQIINIKDQEENEWLLLETCIRWDEPQKKGKDRFDNPYKTLEYMIYSYITTKRESPEIIEWFKKNSFKDTYMSASESKSELFNREYYYSSAFKICEENGYNDNCWSRIFDRMNGNTIGKVSPTAMEYRWEAQYDASKQDTITFYKPSELLFKLLDLEYSKIEGELINNEGDMICFDPSVMNPTYSCLIVRKKDLLTKLEENQLDIFWRVFGEKHIVWGYSNSSDDVRRLNFSGLVHYDSDQLKYYKEFLNE